MRKTRWVFLTIVAVLAGLFAYLNAGERATLNLGFVVLYRLSLPGILFGAFLAGMVTMFVAALPNDIRVRRLLREHRVDRPPPRAWNGDPPP